MDPTEIVCMPFVVMLHNIPVKVTEDGQRLCAYSNKKLCEMFKDFAGELKTTIKVGHNKDGVLVQHGRAFAYAQFKDFQHALAVSDALKNVGRGRRAYLKLCSKHSKSGSAQDDRIYVFKDQGLISVGEIMDKKKRQRILLENDYQLMQLDIDRLNIQLAEQNQALQQALTDLRGAKDDDAASRARIEEQRSAMRQRIEANARDNEKEHRAAQQEILSMESRVRQQEINRTEKIKALQRLRCAERNYRTSKNEKEKFERQCYLEDIEYKRLADMAEEEMKNREQAKREFAALLESGREQRKKAKNMRMAKALQEEGMEILDTECQMCMFEFTRIPTYDELASQGISHEQFLRINRQSSNEERCWRNKAMPCGHTKVCGGCVALIEKQAQETNREPTCPSCRQPVRKFVIARVNANTTARYR